MRVAAGLFQHGLSRTRSAIRSGGRPCCRVPNKSPGPAQAEVDLGQLETVGRGDEGLEPLAGPRSVCGCGEHAAEAGERARG